MLPRFSTNYHIQTLRFPIVSPRKSHSTLRLIQKTPNQGFCRSVVDVLFLWTRFVRQDLDGVKSGGFGSCFLFRVCWFNDFLYPTLYTSLYVSFSGIYTSRIHWVSWGTGTPKIETRLINERFASVMGQCGMCLFIINR